MQNAGEFVVTFPGSYHCGFSHGERSHQLTSPKILLSYTALLVDACIRNYACPVRAKLVQNLLALVVLNIGLLGDFCKHDPEFIVKLTYPCPEFVYAS